MHSTCVLLVTIENRNNVAPQFEKSVYFSQIEIDEETESRDVGGEVNINDLLLSTRSNESWNRTHAFITKVNAKDMDSTMLVYSIDEMQSLFYESGLGNYLLKI